MDIWMRFKKAECRLRPPKAPRCQGLGGALVIVNSEHIPQSKAAANEEEVTALFWMARVHDGNDKEVCSTTTGGFAYDKVLGSFFKGSIVIIDSSTR